MIHQSAVFLFTILHLRATARSKPRLYACGSGSGDGSCREPAGPSGPHPTTEGAPAAESRALNR